jgi:hypothetical protein
LLFKEIDIHEIFHSDGVFALKARLPLKALWLLTVLFFSILLLSVLLFEREAIILPLLDPTRNANLEAEELDRNYCPASEPSKYGLSRSAANGMIVDHWRGKSVKSNSLIDEELEQSPNGPELLRREVYKATPVAGLPISPAKIRTTLGSEEISLAAAIAHSEAFSVLRTATCT